MDNNTEIFCFKCGKVLAIIVPEPKKHGLNLGCRRKVKCECGDKITYWSRFETKPPPNCTERRYCTYFEFKGSAASKPDKNSLIIEIGCPICANHLDLLPPKPRRAGMRFGRERTDVDCKLCAARFSYSGKLNTRTGKYCICLKFPKLEHQNMLWSHKQKTEGNWVKPKIPQTS